MRKINKLKMALGYMEMSEINLQMSKECFLAESKGVSIYEMVEKKTEGATE